MFLITLFCLAMLLYNRATNSKYFIIAVYVVLLFAIDYCGVFTHLFEVDYHVYDAHALNQHPADNVHFKFVQNSAGQCSSDSGVNILLLVKSAVGNGLNRNAIRETWCSSTRSVNCVFVIGAARDMEMIAAEAEQYQDILQGDFIDTYYNNTLKTLTAMRWASEYCASNVSHFVFLDDDYYVSLKQLLKFIASAGNGRNEELFAGFVIQSAPHRHKFSKWYVSLAEWPFHLWPPYVTAGAFILSAATLRTLLASSVHMRVFRFDDIYLSLLALRANVVLTHCDNFHFNRPKYRNPKSYEHVIASHGFHDPNELQRVWTECHLAGVA